MRKLNTNFHYSDAVLRSVCHLCGFVCSETTMTSMPICCQIRKLSLWSSQNSFDLLFDDLRLFTRVEVIILNELSGTDEFCEVPRDDLWAILLSVVKLTVSAKVTIHLICVLAVDFALCEHGESCFVALPGKLFDLKIGARLLPSKLIAREGKNFETFVPILLVDVCQLPVVVGC